MYVLRNDLQTNSSILSARPSTSIDQRTSKLDTRFTRFSRHFLASFSYVVYPGACIDILILFYCLKTLLWRVKFSSPSLLLCARSQAVFGGIHPVKHRYIRRYESTTTGKPLLSSPVSCTLKKVKLKIPG